MAQASGGIPVLGQGPFVLSVEVSNLSDMGRHERSGIGNVSDATRKRGRCRVGATQGSEIFQFHNLVEIQVVGAGTDTDSMILKPRIEPRQGEAVLPLILIRLADDAVGKRAPGAKAGPRRKEREVVFIGKLRVAHLGGDVPVLYEVSIVVGQVGGPALAILLGAGVERLCNAGSATDVASFLIGGAPTPIAIGEIDTGIYIVVLRIDRSRRQRRMGAKYLVQPRLAVRRDNFPLTVGLAQLDKDSGIHLAPPAAVLQPGVFAGKGAKAHARLCAFYVTGGLSDDVDDP